MVPPGPLQCILPLCHMSEKKTTWVFRWHLKAAKMFSDQLVPKMQGVDGDISISPSCAKYSLYLAYKFKTCY